MFVIKLMNDENVPCISNRLLGRGKNEMIKVIRRVGRLLNSFISKITQIQKDN